MACTSSKIEVLCTTVLYLCGVKLILKNFQSVKKGGSATFCLSLPIATQGSVHPMSSLLVLAIAILLSLTSARPLVREVRTDREFQRLLKVSTVIFCVFHVLSSFCFRPTVFRVSSV